MGQAQFGAEAGGGRAASGEEKEHVGPRSTRPMQGKQGEAAVGLGAEAGGSMQAVARAGLGTGRRPRVLACRSRGTTHRRDADEAADGGARGDRPDPTRERPGLA